MTTLKEAVAAREAATRRKPCVFARMLAAGKHFRPERPQQGFWLTSPEHGPTIAAPIFCDDRKAEGW